MTRIPLFLITCFAFSFDLSSHPDLTPHYIDICDQLERLQLAQGVIERPLKKMNAEVDQKMTLEFLLKRFEAHQNPKFNTSLAEGNARMRALLKDIYCIE